MPIFIFPNIKNSLLPQGNDWWTKNSRQARHQTQTNSPIRYWNLPRRKDFKNYYQYTTPILRMVYSRLDGNEPDWYHCIKYLETQWITHSVTGIYVCSMVLGKLTKNSYSRGLNCISTRLMGLQTTSLICSKE